MRVLRLALALCALAAPAAAASRTVTFPLVVDYPILDAALRRDLGLDGSESLNLFGVPGEDCRWATIDEIGLDHEGGKIRLVVKGAAVVGFRLIVCVSPLAWQGEIVLHARPVVGADWQLRFDGFEAEARDLDGQPSPLGGAALALLRDRLEERLRAFHFDLAPPADEAKALIRAAATSDRARPALAAVDSLRPIETIADDEGVRVRIAMDVPEPEEPASPEPPLTDAEAARWTERLDRWDAFLVFTVKMLGVVSLEREVRDELLDILLDGRRELVDTIRQGPVAGTDPVRNLFLSSWDRLRVLARRAVRDGKTGARTFQFITFLAAGDALAALDQAGPGLGLEISTDGLRRLARVLDPDRKGDPIAISDAPDPELRRLFGFRDPPERTPPTPPPTSTTTTTTPGTGTPTSTDVTPTTTAPPDTTTLPSDTTTTPPSTTPPSTAPPVSWLWSPRAAEAAAVPDLAEIGRRLDRWVPKVEELVAYRTVVDDLLTIVVAHRTARVGARLAPVYRHLVPAVAWQESCWRQFVERDGQVTYLLSRTGDVGMMQVNRRVWRGFFDLRKLEWDAVYNAAAGAEILVELLSRFGPREGAQVVDAAARSAYSAYNGGPAAYRRYRSPKASALGRAIDASFYDKYRLVAAGGAGDRVLCM